MRVIVHYVDLLVSSQNVTLSAVSTNVLFNLYQSENLDLSLYSMNGCGERERVTFPFSFVMWVN